MGDRIGYARLSTKEQNIDSQLDQLAKSGCIKVITDTISGHQGPSRLERTDGMPPDW